MLKKIFLCLGLFLYVATAFAQNYPERPSKSPVADFTGTLNDSQKQQLDARVKAFEDSTSNQVAIVLIRTLGDYEIIDYGVGLMRKWGIGQKDKNNGVLVLVAIDDRKMSIQTGYGLEGALPDITTQQIIQNDMRPHFKAGDYYGGLDDALTSIIKATKGEYKAPKKAKQGRDDGGGAGGFIAIIVIVIIIFIISKGGGGGGGKRVIGGRGGASPFWWFLAGNMLGGSGRSSGSDWGGFSGGGGGGSSWGGFGGGSTGGGGSSGSW